MLIFLNTVTFIIKLKKIYFKNCNTLKNKKKYKKQYLPHYVN